jgi:hypothetical protein
VTIRLKGPQRVFIVQCGFVGLVVIATMGFVAALI